MRIPKAPAQPPQDALAIRRRFMAALDALVEQLKTDRSVVAVLLGGSLSHDTVWAGSDIDLVLVTVDDRKPEDAVVCLVADGVNVHAHVMPRAEFRRVADGAVRHSFMHSFLAKGRLVYTHDPTIEALCARLIEMGSSDQQLSCCVPPPKRCRRSTRRTNGWSRAMTSNIQPSGFSTPRRRSPRSR